MAEFKQNGKFRTSVLKQMITIQISTFFGVVNEYVYNYFDMKIAFTSGSGSFPTLTLDQFKKMTDSDYNTRRNAFLTTITPLSSGDLSTLVSSSTGTDLTICPLT